MQDIIWELEEDGKHDEQSEKFERKNAVVKIPAKEKAAEYSAAFLVYTGIT